MTRLVRLLDRLQLRLPPASYLFAVWQKYGDDQAGNLASLLAYYAFLSIFPLLLVLVTVLGIVLHNDPAAQQRVLHSALVDFPIIGDQLRNNIHSLNRTGTGLVIGIVGTTLGARGLTMAVQNAFNTAWMIPFTRRPSFVGRNLRSLGLLLITGIAVTVTGALSGVASVGGHRGALITVGAIAASAALNAGFFVLGFRLAIAREVPWRCFARSACVAGLSWQVLLTVGSYLISHELRHAEAVYGLFGLVLGLLAWLHVQARLTLLVIEADVVRARQLWPRSLDDQRVERGDRLAYTAYAQTQQRRKGVTITVNCDGVGGPGSGGTGTGAAVPGTDRAAATVTENGSVPSYKVPGRQRAKTSAKDRPPEKAGSGTSV
jgi:YihY family inner membrane protein